MSDMCCGECRFFQALSNEPNRGMCHRYAPRAKVTCKPEGNDWEAWFPQLFDEDWCGEFQKREATDCEP